MRQRADKCLTLCCVERSVIGLFLFSVFVVSHVVYASEKHESVHSHESTITRYSIQDSFPAHHNFLLQNFLKEQIYAVYALQGNTFFTTQKYERCNTGNGRIEKVKLFSNLISPLTPVSMVQPKKRYSDEEQRQPNAGSADSQSAVEQPRRLLQRLYYRANVYDRLHDGLFVDYV
ncbi:hypothetical protein TDB9533_02729 [Thalassocella blandensis]|nr:hypothetical protein TDB9533_02729 [Thalassocella blandensis]